MRVSPHGAPGHQNSESKALTMPEEKEREREKRREGKRKEKKEGREGRRKKGKRKGRKGGFFGIYCRAQPSEHRRKRRARVGAPQARRRVPEARGGASGQSTGTKKNGDRRFDTAHLTLENTVYVDSGPLPAAVGFGGEKYRNLVIFGYY